MAVVNADATSILVTVLLFVTASLLSVIAWVFIDFRRTVTKQIATNGRHLDSIISQMWVLIWRLDHIEDYLEDTTDYRPVKAPIPQNPPDEHR